MRRLKAVLGALLGCSALSAAAQGTLSNPIILRTSDDPTLSTATVPLVFPASGSGASLQLQFGFQTEEAGGPDTLFDSLSLTVQSEDGSVTVSLATVDINGPLFAPVRPGMLALGPGSLSASLSASPAIDNALTHQFAYRLLFLPPVELASRNATLFVDLFNNSDSSPSLGWVADVVLVPEPSLGCLLGALALIACRRGKAWR